MGPTVTPWRCFTVYLYRNHHENEEFELPTPIKGDKFAKAMQAEGRKKSGRMQAWNFLCPSDESVEFWVPYITKMAGGVPEVERGNFIREKVKLSESNFLQVIPKIVSKVI